MTRTMIVAMGVLATLTVTALPPPSATAQTGVKFAVVGDSRGADNGVNTAILREIAAALIADSVEFVLFPGDLVNGSGDSATLESQLLNWRTIMQPVYDAGIGVYPCRGNHDAGNVGAWNHVLSGPYALPDNGPVGEKNLTFSFQLRNVFVAGLDQYVRSSRVNLAWLNAQLAASSQPYVFVFAHSPAFAVDHADCLDDYPSQRDSLWRTIAAARERVFFAGHDHFFNHARIDDRDGDPGNDVHQYVVGSAGAPLKDWNGRYDGINSLWTPRLIFHEKQYGYLIVDIVDDQMTITWKHRVAPGVYRAPAYASGDANTDGTIDIADVVYLIAFIFGGRTAPNPLLAGDANGDASISVSDALYLVDYIFSDGPAPDTKYK